jgi:hypothetical protein
MAKLTPINLKRETGRPFSMAFVYTKQGTKLLTGDWATIDQYCQEHFGICHALMITQSKYSMFGVKHWRLLGVNANEHTYLLFISERDLQGYCGHNIWREMGIRRPCFVLHSRDQKNIIRTWRQLPKKYIDFKTLIKTKAVAQP